MLNSRSLISGVAERLDDVRSTHAGGSVAFPGGGDHTAAIQTTVTTGETDASLAVRPSAARSIVETAGTNLVLGALGIATGVIAARWLGPEGRGELAAIQMWPSILASLAMIGLPEALVYYSARSPAQSRRYLLTASLAASAAMSILAGVGYYLMPLLVSTHSVRAVQGARGYLLLLPVSLLFSLPHQLLRGIQHYRLWNFLRVTPALLWLVVIVGAVSLQITDPILMTQTYVALFAAIGAAAAYTVWKRTAGPASPTAPVLTSLMKFGLPTALATLPYFLSVKLDQMMVAALLPARQLGLYSAAVAWSGGAAILSNALAVVVSTQIAANASEPERRRLFSRGVTGAAWLIAAPVVVFSAAAPFGVTAVFGGAFAEAAFPAMVLVAASGLNAFNTGLEELLRGFGKPGATLWAETTAVVIGLPLILILLPRAGLTGASVASLAGYFASTIVLIVYSRRAADLNILTALDPRGIKWSDVSARAIRALSFRVG